VFSQELAVDEVRGVVREAEMKTSERKRAVEILEKHRAKLEKRFLTEIEQKEALEQDELGNVMYLMQRAK
jgi:type III secretion system (T3SS) protein YscO